MPKSPEGAFSTSTENLANPYQPKSGRFYNGSSETPGNPFAPKSGRFSVQSESGGENPFKPTGGRFVKTDLAFGIGNRHSRKSYWERVEEINKRFGGFADGAGRHSRSQQEETPKQRKDRYLRVLDINPKDYATLSDKEKDRLIRARARELSKAFHPDTNPSILSQEAEVVSARGEVEGRITEDQKSTKLENVMSSSSLGKFTAVQDARSFFMDPRNR